MTPSYVIELCALNHVGRFAAHGERLRAGAATRSGVGVAAVGTHVGGERGRVDWRAADGGAQARAGTQLMQHVERISALPKAQQRTVMNVIEAMLAQQERWLTATNASTKKPSRTSASAARVVRSFLKYEA